MAAESVSHPVAGAPPTPVEVTTYAEGVLVGLAGAAAIALWFLLIDVVQGRPLYTPTVLGTALFRGGRGLDDPASLAVSLEMVISFTWIHALIFLLIGMATAWLVASVERNPSLGFGVVLLFVVLQYGFLQVSMIVAEPVLHALAWPAVLGGNLLAAATMVAVIRWRHPKLVIEP
ncbi:MAG TPA: hypothetical protein VKW76_15620 [Candidatus Binatia bacterium]|nr:hypothetical protein [Candidatus Binatia bacterium]